MTEIQFYHLLSTPIHRALPKLMEKALSANMRSVILVGCENELNQLDEALWAVDAASFIPHGTMKDAHPEHQPVYLTLRDENPNGARVIVMTDGTQKESFDGYDKVLDIFDGHDPDKVEAARGRWKHYKDAGFKLSYIQQQKDGGWKSMATANYS